MELPVLCVATAIFALLWGMQNFSRNPVPSICIMIGTVGLTYYLLVLAHYHKTQRVLLLEHLFYFVGAPYKRGYFHKSCLYTLYKQLFVFFYKLLESYVTSSFIMKGKR